MAKPGIVKYFPDPGQRCVARIAPRHAAERAQTECVYLKNLGMGQVRVRFISDNWVANWPVGWLNWSNIPQSNLGHESETTK